MNFSFEDTFVDGLAGGFYGEDFVGGEGEVEVAGFAGFGFVACCFLGGAKR